MAITKVSRGLLSTGIVDNSNATAITIDSSENVTFAGEISTAGVNTITSNTPKITFIESDQSNKQYQIGSFGAAFAIYDASNTQYRYTLTTSGDHIFNEGGQDCDFRVESDVNSNAFYLDGATGVIGLGFANTTAANQLHILGTSSVPSVNMSLQTNDTANARAGITLMSRKADNVNVNATLINHTTALQSSLGISFGSDTATANALDSYEEGTWTPEIDGVSGGDYTMGGLNGGRYTKVGDIVVATATVEWTGRTTAYSGHLVIKGYPFACGAVRAAGTLSAINSGLSFSSGSYDNYWSINIDPGNTFAYIIQNGDGTYSHNPTVGSSGRIYTVTLTYTTS